MTKFVGLSKKGLGSFLKASIGRGGRQIGSAGKGGPIIQSVGRLAAGVHGNALGAILSATKRQGKSVQSSNQNSNRVSAARAGGPVFNALGAFGSAARAKSSGSIRVPDMEFLRFGPFSRSLRRR